MLPDLGDNPVQLGVGLRNHQGRYRNSNLQENGQKNLQALNHMTPRKKHELQFKNSSNRDGRVAPYSYLYGAWLK